jgi:hypothetical protein
MVTLSLFGFSVFLGGYHILPKLILLWSSGKLRLKRKAKPFLQCSEIEEI